MSMRLLMVMLLLSIMAAGCIEDVDQPIPTEGIRFNIRLDS